MIKSSKKFDTILISGHLSRIPIMANFQKNLKFLFYISNYYIILLDYFIYKLTQF